MLKKTIEVEDYENATATIRPLSGPRVYDLEMKGFTDGDAVYAAFREGVVDWENAPLRRGGVAETFDRTLIDQLQTGFVFHVIAELLEYSTLSEDDRKNS